MALALHRGYCVASDLVEDLVSELDKLGADYKLVGEDYHLPKGKAETPRPVMVTDNPVPDGWKRYRRCTKCKLNGVGLDTQGQIRPRRTCEACTDHFAITGEKVWEAIEQAFRYEYLGLPEWIAALDTKTVYDVRTKLREGTLPNVGPERTMEVQEALNAFRAKVKMALQD